MNIELTSQIDAIGTSAETGDVILSVIDGSEWSGEHLLLLQEKLNTYLRFVESGEVYSVYPSALGKAIVIHVYWRVPPSRDAEAFLSKVTSIMEEAGLRFSHGPADALN